MTLTYGTASVEVNETDDVVQVWDLVSDDPKDGFQLCIEVAKIAAGRPIWITADPLDEKLMKFYLTAGFEMKYIAMVKQ